MARFVLLLALVVVALAPAGAGGGAASAGFGQPGAASFTEFALPDELPNVENAGEPTIGIPWNTDHVFFQAFVSTYRCDIEALTNASLPGEVLLDVPCQDVTPAFSVLNVDPMLHADPVTARIFQGGLAGPCSVMGISDDDGATWTPSRNMCSGHQFDHQSIGSGPWSAIAPDTVARNAVHPRATYYCSQGGLAVVVGPSGAACATSVDGGHSWEPYTEVLGGCGSFHGHIRVSEVTGFAVLPFARCSPAEGGEMVGYAYTADNGLTWNSATIPDSEPGIDLGFDPSVGFSYKSGWMYYALANDIGIYVGMSKDDGNTWELLGNSTPGVAPSAWINLAGAYKDPMTGGNLTFTTFTNVHAGDDDRAAITFLGTTNEGSHPFTDCDGKTKDLIWHYYIAQTFDAGQTWTVSRMSEDPVQVGGIWDGGGSPACRNLLDFNDMDIDSHGRVVVGFADGCTGSCADKYKAYAAGSGDAPEPKDSRSQYGTLLVQTAGRGLFAVEDQPGTDVTMTPTLEPTTDEKPVPASSLLVALAGVVFVGLLLRRRR